MDGPSFDGGGQVDVSKLSDADKRELNQFIQAESQKAKIQEGKKAFPLLFSPAYGLQPLHFPPGPFYNSKSEVGSSVDANGFRYSGPQPYGYMLEEMHHGEDRRRQAQQQRRILYTELRWEVYGLE